MFRWKVHEGYDWQLVEGGYGEPVMVGAAFGYGLLDESVTDYGTVRSLIAELKVELARPVELAAGGAGVPEVLVDVDSDTSSIAVRGDREVVAGAWGRLPAFFAAPIGEHRAEPPAVNTWGWARDAVMRTGANAFGLVLLDANPPPADRDKIDRLREHLDPRAAAVRTVFFTNDESLVGVAPLTPLNPQPVLPPAPPRAHRYRVPGTVPASYGGLLYFTAVVPQSEAGFAAGLVLRSHFGAALQAAGMSSPAVGCSIRGLGQDLWVAVETREAPPLDILHRALVATATTPIPDTLVDAVVDEVAGSVPVVRVRERRAVGLPDATALSRAEVRAALAQALQTLHLSDFGQGDIPGYPSLDDPPQEDRRKFTAWFSADELQHLGLPRELAIGQRSLAVVAGADHDVADLDDVAFVVDYAPGCFAIFDHRCVGVDVDVRVYPEGAELLRRLDQHLAGVPRLPQPVEQPDGVAEAVRGRRRLRRRRLVGMAAGVGALVFVIVMAVTRGESQPEPVSERISVGQTATLAGGTKLTVQSIERATTGEHEFTMTVTVRACAGQDLDADDVDPDVQRTIGPSNFQLWTGDGSAGVRVEDDRPQLQATTLPSGECTTGDLIYRMRGDTTDLRLGYDNPFGDDVVWYAR